MLLFLPDICTVYLHSRQPDKVLPSVRHQYGAFGAVRHVATTPMAVARPDRTLRWLLAVFLQAQEVAVLLSAGALQHHRSLPHGPS